jgi:hypothetical protein
MPVILTRRYFSDSPELELIVSIEQPFQDESGYFRCNYHFGGADQRSRFVNGVDEMDALLTAFSMAGTELHFLNIEKFGGKLQWDAGPAESSLPTIGDHWPYKSREAG